MVIIDDSVPGGRVIGEMDLFSAQEMLHDDAVYLHGAQQYHVDELDWERREAHVQPVTVEYYTDAQRKSELKTLAADQDRPLGFGRAAVPSGASTGTREAVELRDGDVLVVEATPAAMEAFVGALKLDYRRDEKPAGLLGSEDMTLIEVVVPSGARIEGRSMHSLRLQYRYGVTLLGVSRMGRQFRERVRHLGIRAGDVLLLYGPNEVLPEISGWLGTLPLAGRDTGLVQRHKAWLATGIFAVAILLASTGVLYLPVALAAVVAIYVITNIIPPRYVYESVEWPVIVLLGSMIPIGAALEATGGTALIAGLITALGDGWSPALVLVLPLSVLMSTENRTGAPEVLVMVEFRCTVILLLPSISATIAATGVSTGAV